MTKLKSIGIQGPLLSWIENCLLDRKQRVAINGCCSDWPIRPTFFFYVGSRLGQIFLSRIRMGCSALNSDLFRKNIVNSPRCTCGAIETLTHYLLNCPHYNIPRQRHIFALNFLIPLSTELLLVGSNELTINQNSEIFLSVQKFILSSKLFTP